MEDETTSDSWVDDVLAEIKGRRSRLPAAQLIRVGFPVLEGVPCGGGCPGMARPPPRFAPGAGLVATPSRRLVG